MPTNTTTPTVADALAEALAAFAIAMAEAIEEERRLQIYGFAVDSLIKGQSFCASVALDTLPTEQLRAVVRNGRRLSVLAADLLATRP